MNLLGIQKIIGFRVNNRSDPNVLIRTKQFEWKGS